MKSAKSNIFKIDSFDDEESGKYQVATQNILREFTTYFLTFLTFKIDE